MVSSRESLGTTSEPPVRTNVPGFPPPPPPQNIRAKGKTITRTEGFRRGLRTLWVDESCFRLDCREKCWWMSPTENEHSWICFCSISLQTLSLPLRGFRPLCLCFPRRCQARMNWKMRFPTQNVSSLGNMGNWKQKGLETTNEWG